MTYGLKLKKYENWTDEQLKAERIRLQGELKEIESIEEQLKPMIKGIVGLLILSIAIIFVTVSPLFFIFGNNIIGNYVCCIDIILIGYIAIKLPGDDGIHD